MVPIICKWAQDINSSIFWVGLFVNMDVFWGDFMLSISVINLNCKNKMAKCCQMHIFFKNCTIQHTLTVADVQTCCIAVDVNSDCVGCIYCTVLHNAVPNCSRCINKHSSSTTKICQKIQRKVIVRKTFFATYTWSRLTVPFIFM